MGSFSFCCAFPALDLCPFLDWDPSLARLLRRQLSYGALFKETQEGKEPEHQIA